MSVIDQAKQLLGIALQLPSNEVSLQTSIHDTESWDSLAHLNLIVALEQALGKSLDTDTLLEIESLADIVEVLEREGS